MQNYNILFKTQFQFLLIFGIKTQMKKYMQLSLLKIQLHCSK